VPCVTLLFFAQHSLFIVATHLFLLDVVALLTFALNIPCSSLLLIFFCLMLLFFLSLHDAFAPLGFAQCCCSSCPCLTLLLFLLLLLSLFNSFAPFVLV